MCGVVLGSRIGDARRKGEESGGRYNPNRSTWYAVTKISASRKPGKQFTRKRNVTDGGGRKNKIVNRESE